MENFIAQVKSWTSTIPKVNEWQRTLLQAVCASWGIALAAQLTVPCYPVPITMQNFAVMLLGLRASPRVALSAVLLYLAYGLGGLPVFASTNVGWVVFSSPAAGYLVGYCFMAWIIASLTQRHPGSGLWRRFGYVLLGAVGLYVTGLCWLAHFVGWQVALQTGLLPFVGVLPAKAALAAYLTTPRARSAKS